MDRKKLLNLAETNEDKILLSRVIDVVSATVEKNIVRNTQFLNGHEINLVRKLTDSVSVSCGFYGGYEEAERCMLVCYPDFLYPEEDDIPIKVIKARTKNRHRLSHRDYMGAVLNLGIKREKIGDIVVCDDCGYIFCTEDIADYIISQIQKIGNCGVVLEASAFKDVQIPPKQFKEITDTVSSVRLDTVVSSATGLSRSEASALILRGAVSVNWEMRDKNDFKLKDGDVLSVHGYGRILLYKIGGTSKKGRIFITLRKFV